MRLNIVVLNDLLDLAARVLEVGLCAQALGNDSDVVIVSCGIKFILYSSNIYLFLIDHNHHLFNIEIGQNLKSPINTYLPLVLILGDAPIPRASKHISSHVVMRPLWFGVNDSL